MEIRFENCSYDEINLNFKIDESTIVGITGTNKDKFIGLIKLDFLPKGNIYFNNIKITKDNIWQEKRKIVFIRQDFIWPQFLRNVLDYMLYYMKKNNLIVKDDNKKIISALKIVGLDKNYLNREIITLSTSEKKLIQIATYLLSNPEVIIIEDPFLYFDLKNQNKIYLLLQRLQEQYKKNILIISDNSNILYKYTSQMFFVKNNDILIKGLTREIYQRVDWLNRNKFSVPDIVLFTYKARKMKKVKLDYHHDIRDIIKDIYKHV